MWKWILINIILTFVNILNMMIIIIHSTPVQYLMENIAVYNKVTMQHLHTNAIFTCIWQMYIFY